MQYLQSMHSLGTFGLNSFLILLIICVISVPVCQELGVKYCQGPRTIYAQNFNEAYVLSTGNIIGEIAAQCEKTR